MTTRSSTTTTPSVALTAAALFLASPSVPLSSGGGGGGRSGIVHAFSPGARTPLAGPRTVSRTTNKANLRNLRLVPSTTSTTTSTRLLHDDGGPLSSRNGRRRRRPGNMVVTDPMDLMLEARDEQQRLNFEFTNDLLFGNTDLHGWSAVDEATAAAAAAVVAASAASTNADTDAANPATTAVDPVKALIEDQFETVAREGGVHNVIPVVPTPVRIEIENEAPELEEIVVTDVVEEPSSIIILEEAAKDAQEAEGGAQIIPPYQPPNLRTIIKFAIPAVGVWLCDPLLSLIDTAAVGLLAGTNHQAALSPAVAVVNYSALLLAFLFTGTTNFVASAAAKQSPGSNKDDNQAAASNKAAAATGDENDAGSTLLSSLQLSLYVGATLGTILFTLAPTLVRTLIGRSTPIDPTIFNPAVLYVRIRSLGFPAAAVLGSAQAACLGLKDIKSPFLVLGTAAVVNLLGDMFLVGCRNPFLYGAAGAAWATVLSQFAAVYLFLGLLKAKKPTVGPGVSSGDGSVLARLKRAIRRGGGSPSDVFCSDDDSLPPPAPATSSLQGGHQADPKPFGFASKKFKKVTALFHHRRSELSDLAGGVDAAAATAAATADATDQSDEISARGFLSDGDFRKRHILRVPTRDHWLSFLPYVVPVTTTSVGRVSLFLSMAHVVSSCMGVVGMAAQTIVLALFDALCPLAQSLSLTAQAFVPAALEHHKSMGACSDESNEDGLGRITRQFLKAGSIFGGLGVLAVGCVPLISRLFTTDPAVVAQVNAVAPHLAGIFAMHGVVMASEGVLLGRRDINFLGWMYGAFFALMPAIMMRVKHGALTTGKAAGLQSIWTIFLGYQFARMGLWALRAMRPLKSHSMAAVEA